MPRVYVTDYTDNEGLPKLPPQLTNEPWAKDMEGRVLPIILESGQEEFVHLLEPGLFYRFRNMSMVAKDSTRYQWMGRIGGGRRLFDRMSPASSDDELRALNEYANFNSLLLF
jgi:hypothetical protein